MNTNFKTGNNQDAGIPAEHYMRVGLDYCTPELHPEPVDSLKKSSSISNVGRSKIAIKCGMRLVKNLNPVRFAFTFGFM